MPYGPCRVMQHTLRLVSLGGEYSFPPFHQLGESIVGAVQIRPWLTGGPTQHGHLGTSMREEGAWHPTSPTHTTSSPPFPEHPPPLPPRLPTSAKGLDLRGLEARSLDGRGHGVRSGDSSVLDLSQVPTPR